MPTQGHKLMLMDGNSVLYRAFFALPDLSTAGGMHTNAALGFTMMLLKLLDEVKPTHVLVAFDAGKKTFRHDKYADYKGTREKTPSELSGQFEIAQHILRSLKITYLQLENYEADDIIGTFSKRALEEGIPTVIVSGDRDMMQLISPGTELLVMSRKGVTEVDRYDVEALKERYGLSPEQMIDLKGLMGDSSDNIPGIPGVGEKTALKLLAEYHTVENVLDHIDEVSGKSLQGKLREHRELAVLSKELATIFRDVPLEEPLDSFLRVPYDPIELLGTLKKYEFKKLTERLHLEERAYQENVKSEQNSAAQDGTAALEAGTHFPTLISLVDSILTSLESPDSVSDKGAIGLYVHAATDEGEFPRVQFLSLATQRLKGFVAWDKLTLQSTDESEWKSLQTLLNSCTPIIPNAKETQVLLRPYEIEIPHSTMDPLLACYLLNPSDGIPDFREILQAKFGWSVPPAAKSVKGQLTEDLERKNAFLTAMAWGSVLLADSLTEQLQEGELWDLYQDLELPLSFVLAEMEILGVRVEAQTLKDLGEEFTSSLQKLQAQIYELAGTEFNINSPKQLGEILFDKLGLPADKKTKTGYSTSADVLERLADYSPIVKKILEYRQLGKLQSTYVEGLLKVIREDGRIHTSFNQTTTATGRLSSTEPNLQNIPIRMEEGRRLRQAFVPTYPDWRILSADYSQIELRILAHISEDENMIDAFSRDIDIHTRTAADVFGVEENEVTGEMRRAAKAVNFGIVYGISDYGLSQNLGITRKQAGEFISNYFSKFPGVKRYMENIVEQARRDGYVTTLLNRRRDLPDISARNFNLRSFAERTAMNTPIQGSAADILKKAMVHIQQVLRTSGLVSRMLLTVHDELIFEGPADEMDKLANLVRTHMEGALSLSVPLKVDIHIGETWYEAK